MLRPPSYPPAALPHCSQRRQVLQTEVKVCSESAELLFAFVLLSLACGPSEICGHQWVLSFSPSLLLSLFPCPLHLLSHWPTESHLQWFFVQHLLGLPLPLRCLCAAVLHFKINIWILISKKFTLGYGSSVRCLLNPGSRQAPSRGAVTEGGRGGREALCLHLLAASLVGSCMCTPQSVSLSLGVRVCECVYI